MNVLNYKDQDPIGNLLLYLNSMMDLTEAFNPSILPMLEDEKLQTELIVGRPGEIITKAYWLEDTYGYLYKMIRDKNGAEVKKIIQIYPPKTIMVDPISFFQNEPSESFMAIIKGATIVPFSQEHFAALRLSAPEADALANRVMAETLKHSTKLVSILELKADDRYHEMIEHYGKNILQCFSQKNLALFLNYTPEHLNKLIAADRRSH